MITLIKSNKEISFELSAHFSQKAMQFVKAIDKKVFEEQLVTKRIKDIEVPESWLKFMIKQKLESIKNKDADIDFMPY
jgi:hypothetical protein